MVKELRITIALLFISLSTATLATQTELPALNALPNETSISGLSSGAFMAAQFHVAYSEELVGVGGSGRGALELCRQQSLQQPVYYANSDRDNDLYESL